MTQTMGALDNQGRAKSVSNITGKSKAIRLEPMATLGCHKNKSCKEARYLFGVSSARKFTFSETGNDKIWIE